jgi:hypothetical protein
VVPERRVQQHGVRRRPGQRNARVLHRRHAEEGRAAGDDPIREIGVAERGECVVADAQHALAQALLGADGEVPCQVEVLALDVRPLQRGEDRLHARAPRVVAHRAVVVAVRAERGLRLERMAARVAKEAKGDDVAVALRPVPRGADVEVAVGVRLDVGVHLGPDRLALAGGRVDHDRRLAGIEGARHVGDGHQARAPEVKAPHEGVDRRPGLKPSLRLYSSGRIGTPAALRGIAVICRFSRLPVGVDASARVKWSFGHGCRQTAGSNGSQPCAAAGAAVASTATSSPPRGSSLSSSGP